MAKAVVTRNGYVTVEKTKLGWHAVSAPNDRLGYFRTRAGLLEAINAN